MITLSEAEREKFALWCEQDAASTLAIVEQMAKINVSEVLQKVKRTEALAQQVVARILRSIETTEIR